MSDKHDFQPSATEPIVHGIGHPPVAADELTAVTRERDALHAVLERLVAAKDEKDANGLTLRYCSMKRGLWERARETLIKLDAGELRKPAA